MNQKHIKKFLTGLRAFQAGWFLCLFCRAEVTLWQSLRGGSAAPGGPRPTELCVRCRCSVHEQAAIENDRVTVVCHQSLCVSVCQRVCVCAEERSCFACSNVLSWVTPRPGGPVFQIVSCGYSATLQQKHILADLVWFVEHHLLGLKCVFDVLSGNEVHIFWMGVSDFYLS